MDQPHNTDEKADEQSSVYENIFKFIRDNKYLAFFGALGVLLLGLAFSSEAGVGSVTYKGQANESERKYLMWFGLSSLVAAPITQFGADALAKRKRIKAQESFEENPEGFQEVMQRVSSTSNEYREALSPFMDAAEQFERQDKIRLRLVEWIRRYPQKDWLSKTISMEFIEEFSPRYILPDQENALRQDLRKCISILVDGLERGQPFSPKAKGFSRSIDSKYLYKESMERMKQEIILSLEKARELDDCTEEAKTVLTPFIDVLISDLETDI